MTEWSAAYRPWHPIVCHPIPVPWARSVGVPVDFIELPGPVAAADAEGVIGTAQVMAYLRVCAAKAAFTEAEARRSGGLFKHQWKQAAQRRYEPGLNRFVCPECGEAGDVWADDDGRLQDVRDVVCGHKHAPAVKIHEVDGTA